VIRSTSDASHGMGLLWVGGGKAKGLSWPNCCALSA
jgi:hypothetical protein